MIVGFDLDGTLDKPALAALAKDLLELGHIVHVITSVFPESGDWQSQESKFAKLLRLGIPTYHNLCDKKGIRGHATLHVLTPISKDIEPDIGARLRDLGLQKGNLTERLGIEIFFDDSETFCEMIPRMDGHVTVLRVM